MTARRQASIRGRYRDGELLAQFQQGISDGEIDALLRSHGAHRASRLRGESGVEKLILKPGAEPEAVANALRANHIVTLAEPNYIITGDTVAPNDPRFSEQWALSTSGRDIGVARAWEQTVGSPETVVAVIDSGIDFTHPDLIHNEWTNNAVRANRQDDDGDGFTGDAHGWDFVTDSNEIKDPRGHGTAMAGIIAAEGNNATGISGVMWRASLMSLRVLDNAGRGSISSAIEALDYAVAHGAQVINCSWSTDDASMALMAAINRAAAKGVLVICSAGNEGRDLESLPRYPASFELNNLISVAASDDAGQLASTSDWGAKHVAVAAPGVNILTTGASGDYQSVSGTSAAAAVVTGIVGLIKTLRPWLNVEQTRAMILEGTQPLTTAPERAVAKGIVNAAGSLAALDILASDAGLSDDHVSNGGAHQSAENQAASGENAQSGLVERPSDAPGTPGVPGPGLPSLNQMRSERPAPPHTPPAIPSTMRHQRVPRAPRNNRLAGDPLSASGIVGAPADSPPARPFSLLAALDSKYGSSYASPFDNTTRQISDSSPSLSWRLPPIEEVRKGPAEYISASAVVRPEPLTPLQSPGAENVVWTNMVGVSASGNNLTKTAASAWGNAGASSTRAIASGDGYMEFTATEANSGRMAGLSNGDTDQSWQDIDYAIYVASDGNIYVYEAGAYLGGFGGYTAGDLFRISVTGGVVRYSRNGTVFCTSGRTPVYPLLVDTALHGNNSTVTNAVISGNLVNAPVTENVFWANVVGVSVSGNSLTSTSYLGWGASGASSTRAIASGDGYMEFTATEANSGRMAGLSNGDTDQSWQDIDYAIYVASDGNIYVYEAGAYLGGFGAYAAGDRFRVAVEGGAVKYRRNGTVFYTSGVAPTYPLVVDTALAQNGATLTNVVISGALQAAAQNVFWTNPTANVTVTGNSLTKSANGLAAWDAGAVATRLLASGDGYVEVTASENNKDRLFGFSTSGTVPMYGAIDFGIRQYFGSLYIIESNGTNRGSFGGYTAGDKLRIAVEGTAVKYYRNAVLLYTSTLTPVYPLKVTACLYEPSSTLTNAIISGTLASLPSTTDQYVRDFHQSSLNRQPASDQLSYWNDILRTAYGQGQSSTVMAAREMGRTLFESAEYIARGRSDHDYVYDLYMAYLQREPDQQGWDYWTSQVSAQNRENVRRAFDECAEFAAVASRQIPNGAPSNNVSNVWAQRLEPLNATGGGGVDPLSRNFSWTLPLLNLKGRAGLDLGLALSYNSLVWTQSGPYIYFDEDNGFPTPGFRLGFPTIQEKYFDAQVGRNAYLMITSAGSHVELRQVGTSGTYESADSSYLQLTESGSNLIVKATDGTQLTYSKLNNEYRCTEVKDNDGNYLTISYNWMGHITSILDTLGRTVSFSYDANQNPSLIKQSWNGQTHQWASFGYGTQSITPGFSGVAVSGISNGALIPVLTQVGLDDGSRYNFEYSVAGQVSTIRHYAADGHQRAYTSYDLSPSSGDCPRVTAVRHWAENWNGTNNVPAEAVTTYSVPAAAAIPDGSGTTGTMCQVTLPDNTSERIYYHSSGWDHGLPIFTESYDSLGVRQRWVSTSIVQDNTALGYLLNPRATEINIYDPQGNHKRQAINYTSIAVANGASCNLPSDIYEYAADGVSILKHSHTDYQTDAVYLNRRLIGLPQAQYLYDGSNVLFSKVDYLYDGAALQNPGAATQHDDDNYGAGFVQGRGLLTSVRRWDVTAPNDASKTLVTNMVYHTTGTLYSASDPSGHQTRFSYTDAFSDGVNHNTYAYPTAVTDPDNYASTIQYDYDKGVVTKTQGPPAQGQSQGALQTMEYDVAGRLQKVTSANGAYTRWGYPSTQDRVQVFTTPRDIGTEAFSGQILDGDGRVRYALGDFPNSTGLFRAVYTIYDRMGRMARRSNPAEVSSDNVPAGEDAGGWHFTEQAYDWKGRPTVTTHPDTTSRSISYGGCGCAGGEVMTMTDEVGRQQKVTYDVLGRLDNSQVLNTNSTVYTTITNTYNALDQLTSVVKRAAASGVSQTSTMTYDGYGRLSTQHAPEQSAGSSTVYNYYADGAVQKVTDARGAINEFTYNGRHRPTGVVHTLSSNSTINISYGYDAAGNRISMTDPQGSTSYVYDQMSRLTSESRYINALGRSYKIDYSYTAGAQLQSITDPFNSVISYNYDATARLTGVTGSAYANVTTYVSDVAYRAWGGVASASFGNNTSETVRYNSQLEPSEFRLMNGNGSSRLRENYDYYADGRLQKITDLDDTAGNNPPSTLRFMSRTYSYDQVGRVIGSNPVSNAATPYHQTYNYDEFDNMTGRTGSYGFQQGQTDSATFTDNRRDSWTYDPDVRLTISPANSSSNARSWSYDAAGQLISTTETGAGSTVTYSSASDGDGQIVYESVGGGSSANADYLLRSTVLGGTVLTKLDTTGDKSITYTPTGGLLYPQQSKDSNGAATVEWIERNPQGLTEVSSTGALSAYDPLGNYVPMQTIQSYGYTSPLGTYGPVYAGAGSSFGNANNYSTGCLFDGAPADCNKVRHYLIDGLARVDTNMLRPWTVSSSGSIPFGMTGTWVRDSASKVQHNGPPTLKPQGSGSSSYQPDEMSGHWEYSFITGDMFSSGGYAHHSQSSCEKEVLRLASIPFDKVAQTKANTGVILAYNAIDLGADAKRMPVDGFKDELVRPYQLGDVYKHIWAHAGAMLLGEKSPDYGFFRRFLGKFKDWSGKSGYQIDKEETEKDRLQSLQDFPGHPSEEAVVELRDDEAGRQVGNAMGQAWDGNLTKQQLQDTLRSILCDH